MCGIVGYVGARPARDIVVDALRRMEYRGYDSAGIALIDGNGGLTVRRRAGRLASMYCKKDIKIYTEDLGKKYNLSDFSGFHIFFKQLK